MKRFLIPAVLCLVLPLGVPALAAAAYPDKIVQFVVPFGPGGSTDVATRLLLKTFNKNFPKEGVVVNVAGAGGAVGSRKVRESAPDGYTLLSFNTILPVLRILDMIDFSYQELTPVALFSTSDTGVFVRNDSPYKNMDDFIADAKKRPGKIRFGVGFGTLAHLGALALEQKAGIQLNIVDAGGGEQKAASLLGGHIDAYFEPTPPVTQYLESKTFRCIGIFSEKQNPGLPGVSTMKEHGIDVVLMQNNGIFAPKGTPEDVLSVLRGSLKKTCADEAFRKELAAQTLDVVYIDGQAYIDLLAKEFTTLKQVVGNMQKK
ncbi:MAG: tripartite tricarboxylate transporter substrate binding protein [Desulfovibrionaceae bacterium]|nr:tripartite tricarboxylate transporter substrate binding protein [Desulfovibrionaceae bacterium]